MVRPTNFISKKDEMRQYHSGAHHNQKSENDAGDLLHHGVSTRDNAKERALIEGLVRVVEEKLRAAPNIVRHNILTPSPTKRNKNEARTGIKRHTNKTRRRKTK